MVILAEIIGRTAELDRLVQLAQRVRADERGAIASIWGDAGIGKSTLVTAARQHLASHGFAVLDTALTAAETGLGWAGLHHLLPAGLPGLPALPAPQRAALLGALGRAPADAVEPGTVAAALATTLRTLAEDGPVAVVVDDLHWLDTATAGALAFALRSCADRAVLVLVASRPASSVPLEPDRLFDDDRTERIDLAGLSPAGLHHLLSRHCGVVLRRPELIRLHELTGGNPLYAIEAGRLVAAGRAVDDTLVPPSLQAAIADRLSRFPGSTQRALEVAALPADPTVSLVRRALPDVEVEELLVAAEDGGVIRVRGDRITFTHPMLRAGVLDGLGGLRRRSLLRCLAQIVTDPDERALFLAEAFPDPDEGVAAAVEEAATRAIERGAPLLAAERFRIAASHSPGNDDRARRLVRAAQSAYQGGDPVGALEAADQAIGLSAERDIRLDAGMSVVLALAATDELSRALQRAESLLADMDGHPAGQVRVLRTIARIHAFNDVPAASAAIARAEALAPLTGSTETIANVTVVSALIRQQRGDPVDVDEIAEIAGRSTSSAALSARSLLLELLTWTDRVAEAIALGDELLLEAEQLGSVDDMNAIRDQLADACFRAGRWERAAELVRASLEADRLTHTKGPADCRPADLAQTLAALGRHEEAAQLLAISLAHEGFAPVTELQRHARAGFIHLAAGRWTDAVEHLRAARSHALAMGEGDLGAIPFRADLVEALLHVGAADEAAEVADEHAEMAARSELPRGLAESARTSGLVAAARGDQASAIAAFERAVNVHDRWSVPFEHGRTFLALGAALRRAGRRAQAAERLDQAAATFSCLGARPWLERVAEERDRLGTRRSPSDELTATEARIAEQVAAGRSNAEIAALLVVSLRTVESNLTRIYRKLGVRSRTELAARLHRVP